MHQNASPPRRALKHQAYLQLKQLILDGELRPGSVLSERDLADRLEMSRTPIHTALERLEADELVTLAPQQGIVVREMSLRDVVNQFELRQAIEPYVLRRLAGKLKPDQVRRLRANLAVHGKALREMRTNDLARSDAEFHLLFCEFLGNDEMTRVMIRMRDRVHCVIRRITSEFPERFAESYDEHEAIADAVIEGDGDRAAKLLIVHLQDGMRRCLLGE